VVLSQARRLGTPGPGIVHDTVCLALGRGLVKTPSAWGTAAAPLALGPPRLSEQAAPPRWPVCAAGQGGRDWRCGGRRARARLQRRLALGGRSAGLQARHALAIIRLQRAQVPLLLVARCLARSRLRLGLRRAA